MKQLKICQNPNKDEYELITQKVKDNDNYCPCQLKKNEDTKCICKIFREQTTEGPCICRRYFKKFEN